MKWQRQQAELRDQLGPYWSTIPVTWVHARATDPKTGRATGGMTTQRVHVFPGAVQCKPSSCRECYREHYWHADQTRGLAGTDAYDSMIDQLRDDGLIDNEGRVTERGYGIKNPPPR